jgi:hypothetical protein
LIKAMRVLTPYLPDPIFEPSADIQPCKKWPDGRKGLVQLQAADFLAYEAAKSKRDRVTGRTREFRKSLEELLRVEMSFSIPTLETIDSFRERVRVKRRSSQAESF